MTEIKQPKIRFKGHINDWKQRKLGDLGSVAMNKRIFKDETSDSGEIPFYKIGTFGGKPDAYISRELYEEYKEKYPYPKIGDVLISASGSIGRTVVYQGEEAYFQDSNIVWLNHDDKLVNEFLEQFYSFVTWKGLEGSTIKRLYNKTILDTDITIPKKEEQSKIGDFFKTLDETIALYQQKLEVTKQFKQTMLKKMFPKNGETTPEIRFKGFTDDWVEMCFFDICSIEKGNQINKDTLSKIKTEVYNIPVINGSRTPIGYTNKSNTNFGLVMIEGGDVGRVKMMSEPFWLSSHAYLISSDNKHQYLQYLFEKNYNKLNDRGIGITIKNLSKGNLISLKLFLSNNIEEQEKIGNFFKELDYRIDTLYNNLEMYKNFKKAMLQRMFV